MRYVVFIIISIIMAGCSTLHCTKFGYIEYCAPSYSNKSIKDRFVQNNTEQEKKINLFIESKKLQIKWLSTIQDVSKYLTKNNTSLSGAITPSVEGLSDNNDYNIKLIHTNNNVEIILNNKLKDRADKEFNSIIQIYGKERLKKYPQLLLNNMPVLTKIILQLNLSKETIAREIDLILRAEHEAKLLANYYLNNKHKVYVTTKDISPHVDIKGNLYIPKNTIKNSQDLNLIMLHEAFHLLPVGISNEYIAKSLFGGLSSEKFAKDNALSLLANLSLQASSKYNDAGVEFNTLLFSQQFTSMFSNVLTNNEFVIDARVLSYIGNDSKLCNNYYNLLKSHNLEKSKIVYQRERLPLIKDTCQYMQYYSFNYLPNLLSKGRLNNQKALLKKLSIALKSETDPKAILNIVLVYISREIVSKNYHNANSRKIMLKWYSKIFESMFYPMQNKINHMVVKPYSNMDDQMLNILSKGKNK